MPDICYTDASRVDVGVLRGASLNTVWGDSGNDFELTVDIASPERIEDGALVYVEGTEYGGVVDEREASSSDGTVRYRGRSWHGMLRDRVLCPDAGADYLTVSGEANAVLLSLVSRMGLSDVMTVSSAASGVEVKHQFERFCDAYSGIRAMLSASGARLAVAYDSVASRAVLSAVPVVDWSDGPTSDQAGVDVTRVSRPYNHLVCLGSGELRDRVVQHWYADEAGKVSGKQSLFGVDERATTYDYSNAGADELSVKGPKKLSEYQRADSMDATLDVDGAYAVGDVVPGTDVGTGTEVSVVVGTVDATVDELGVTVTYRAGGTAQSGASSGSSESSGSGGAAYAAGEGISIVGRTISAEVTQAKLDAVSAAVSKVSEAAQGVANDLAAETARATKAEDTATSDRAAIRAEFADADKAETTRAKAAEKANADAVANEAKARDAADAALGKRIDAALKVFTSTARTNVIDKALTLDMVKDVFDHSIVIANQLRLMPFWTDGKTAAIYTGNRENTSGHPYATVRADGTRYGETFPKWSELTGKPFSAIGAGLTVTNGTLSADVKAAPVQAVTATAPITATAKDGTVTIATDGTLATAEGVASEAKSRADADSALSGLIDAEADARRGAVSRVSEAVAARVASVTGSGAVTASTGAGMAVTVSHAASGVSAGAYGPTADSAPGFGSKVTVGARLSVDASGHVTSAQGRSVTIPSAVATQTSAGLMSAADKKALDAAPSTYQPAGDYAASHHTHAASDVTSGVLPVARGGTGNGSGNAATATRLRNARTVTLKGAVTGSASFDGSEDVTITCEGQGAAAGFLAAHPVGSVFETTSAVSPAGAYGGTWERVPSLGAFKWERKA